MKKLFAILMLLSSLAVAGEGGERVGEVLVFGTKKIDSERVKEIAAVKPGDEIDEAAMADVRNRLVDSGLFETVSVDVRYDSLGTGGTAVLVIFVEDRRAWWRDVTIRPTIQPSSELGFSAGVKVSFFDQFNLDEVITVPLVFGGQTDVGVELRKYLDSPLLDRVIFAGGYRDLENPHFDIADERSYFNVALGKRMGGMFVELLAGGADVTFGDIEDDFTHFGARITFDTRRDIFLPDDAVYFGLEVQRYQFGEENGSEDANIVRLDARGYKHLFGRLIFAASARAEMSDVDLPDYIKPYLGGFSRLRGFDEDEFIGDNLAIGTAELRLPLSPLTSALLYGLHGFYNVGSVYDDGIDIGDADFLHGYGIGAFFTLEDIGIVVDLGTNQETEDLVVHVGGRFSF